MEVAKVLLPARTLSRALGLSLVIASSTAAAAPATLTVKPGVMLGNAARAALVRALGAAPRSGTCDEPGCVAAPATPADDGLIKHIVVAPGSIAGNCQLTVSARRPKGREHRATVNTGCGQKDLVSATEHVWRSALRPSLDGKPSPLVTVVVVDDDRDGKRVDADALLDNARARNAVDADALLKAGQSSAPGARYRTIFDVAFLTQIISRSFSFNDLVGPIAGIQYESGATPSLGFDVALYPFVAYSKSRLAEFGLHVAYRSSIGAHALSPLDPAPVSLVHDNAEVGLRYRLNFLRRASSAQLTFSLDVGYQRMRFAEQPFGGSNVLPNVGHTYIKVTPLDLRFPFYSSRAFGMGVEGRFALLGITSSGDIEAEDRSGWGNASGYGLDVGASLFTRLYYFELAAAFDYRRIVMSFDGDCVRLGLGCNLAGGATDQTTMFTMRAAIKY